MRRLFSTFARGWPGAGLLVMRCVGGIAMVARAMTFLRGEVSTIAVLGAGLAIGAGVLLIAGLWTPVAGLLVAVIATWCAVTQAGDLLASVLLATIGVALALIGPGWFSIDGRLFGWKRIDVRPRPK